MSVEQPDVAEMKEVYSPSLDEALTKILDYDDPEYIEEHRNQITQPRHHLFGSAEQSIEIVGPKHISSLESPMMQATLGYVHNYLERVPKDKQLVMVEGFHRGRPFAHATLEESVARGGEPMAITFVAKQAGAEVVSPEVPEEVVVQKCKEAGIDLRDVALFYALRGVPGFIRNNGSPPYAALAACLESGLIDWEEAKGDKFVPAQHRALEIINHYARKRIGHDYGDESKFAFELDEARSYCDPSVHGHIVNKVATISSTERDRGILAKIYEEVASGKSPLLIYGASHIVKLRPALAYIYGENDKLA